MISANYKKKRVALDKIISSIKEDPLVGDVALFHSGSFISISVLYSPHDGKVGNRIALEGSALRMNFINKESTKPYSSTGIFL